MPYAIALFVGIGGLDAMNHLGEKYFCEPGLTHCNTAVVGFLSFWVVYWWAIVVGLALAGRGAAAVYVISDSALPVWQRLCWLAALFFLGVLAAPVYCIVRLRQLRLPRAYAIA